MPLFWLANATVATLEPRGRALAASFSRSVTVDVDPGARVPYGGSAVIQGTAGAADHCRVAVPPLVRK